MHNKAFRKGPRFVAPISAAAMVVAASNLGFDLEVTDLQIKPALPPAEMAGVKFDEAAFYAAFPQPKKAVG